MISQKFRLGDVVVTEFPFSNQRETKRRPGIVLLDIGDDDVVLGRVTSADPRSEYDVVIQSWQQAGLNQSSIVRLSKLTTFVKTDIVRKIGSLDDFDLKRVREAIQKLWLSV